MTKQQITALTIGSKAALDLAAKNVSALSETQQRTLGVVAVCQFCVESATVPTATGGGWFTSRMSQPPYNNPFGIQAMRDYAFYGAFDELSWEIENGQKVEKHEMFQRFPDLPTAFALHQRLLLLKKPVLNALSFPGEDWAAVCEALGPQLMACQVHGIQTTNDFALCPICGEEMKREYDLTHCTYSTNPAYPKVLVSIGTQTGLDRPGWMEWYAAGADPARQPLPNSKQATS